MKVLGLVCSPRKKGNTEVLVQEALAGAENNGAITELLTVWDKDIKPCDGCRSCVSTGKCHVKDDMQAVYKKLLEADGIIWGTPVYFFSVTAQAKILMDRCYSLYRKGSLCNKVGGVVTVAASIGHVGAWNLFNTFFSLNHMLSTDVVCGYAREKGDIRKDKHAMKAASELGRQMVLIVNRQFTFPKEFDVPIASFVDREYGINACPAMGRFEP